MNYKFQLRLRSIHLFNCTVSTCSIKDQTVQVCEASKASQRTNARLKKNVSIILLPHTFFSIPFYQICPHWFLVFAQQ